MDDLISRKALLEQIDQQRGASKTGFPKQSFVVGDVINCIRNAPAVEAEPVRHGRYARKSHDEWVGPYYKCLECGVEMMIADEEGQDIEPNICPNCGAKMNLEGCNEE